MRIKTIVDEKWNVTAEFFFQGQVGFSSKRVWLRQEILKPANEDRARFGWRDWFSL